MLHLREVLESVFIIFLYFICTLSLNHRGIMEAPSSPLLHSTLNNSCFPVKHSKLVGSDQLLGFWISNLIHKFSCKGEQEAKTTTGSWGLGSPILGAISPCSALPVGLQCPAW